MDTAAALDLALDLADRADRITLDRFRARDLKVSTKPDLTPVSEADEAAERAIRDRVADVTDHAVVGEEFGMESAADAEYRWIVDPIDGTKNYVRGVPIWATCIGLERRGNLIVGVVSAPALGMRWWAGEGLGAFRDGDAIHVSAVSELADAHLSFAWDREDPAIGTNLRDLSHRCWRTRGIGDFWQHLLVAEGAFDIAVDAVVSLWDIAALVPIIQEAAGQWSTTDGRADVNGNSFVTTNGVLHPEVIAALA